MRSATTIGRSDSIALLATLVESESDEIEPEHPGWRGDYGMLFEDDDERALYLRIAVWENNRYIQRLVDAFNGLPRLKRIRADKLPNRGPFQDLYFWRGDTGSIAMASYFEPVDRFYTMFLAVGPDFGNRRIGDLRRQRNTDDGFPLTLALSCGGDLCATSRTSLFA